MPEQHQDTPAETPESAVDGHVVWPQNYDWDGYGFDTRQVRAGEFDELTHGARITPVYLSSGFRFESFDQQAARFGGTEDGHIYSRNLNPTNSVAERRIASLEGGTEAVVLASGQAAITMALLGLAQAGDHIVSTASIYSGTRILFERTFARLGVTVDFIWDYKNPEEWERIITDKTVAIFSETIPNPKNDVVDVDLIGEVAARHRLPFVIDNTIATPYLLRPFEHGAHIVVHSSTKFLTGQGAVLSGVVVDGGNFDWNNGARDYPLITGTETGFSFVEKAGNKAFAAYLRSTIVNDIGAGLSPFNAFLLQQGVETLSLRMERHVDSALTIARWLAEQPAVESVDHAGLPDHPDHEVAQRYYNGRSGSVFSVTVKGGREGARIFMDRLQVFTRMTNIGDVRSMILHPATATHTTFDEKTNAALGIHQGLLRLSIGIETVDDLIADLAAGLAEVERRLG